MLDDIIICTKVINKESIRTRKSLFQKVLLKKANSQLIYEMIKNDDDNRKKKYIIDQTTSISVANKVAHHLCS